MIYPQNFTQVIVYKKICKKCEKPSRYGLAAVKPDYCGVCGETIRMLPERKEILTTPAAPYVSPDGDCKSDIVYKVKCDCGDIIRYSKINGERPNYCGGCGTEIRYEHVREETLIMPDTAKILKRAGKPCIQSR